MGTKVVVTTSPGNRVVVNSQKQNVIRSVGLTPSGTTAEATTQLRALTDVDATNLANNSTVVYDSDSDTFIVKKLPEIDGGSF